MQALQIWNMYRWMIQKRDIVFVSHIFDNSLLVYIKILCMYLRFSGGLSAGRSDWTRFLSIAEWMRSRTQDILLASFWLFLLPGTIGDMLLLRWPWLTNPGSDIALEGLCWLFSPWYIILYMLFLPCCWFCDICLPEKSSTEEFACPIPCCTSLMSRLDGRDGRLWSISRAGLEPTILGTGLCLMGDGWACGALFICKPGLVEGRGWFGTPNWAPWITCCTWVWLAWGGCSGKLPKPGCCIGNLEAGIPDVLGLNESLGSPNEWQWILHHWI